MDLETALRNNLITLARVYAAATGYKLSTISMRFASDSRFFDKLTKPKPIGFTIRVYVRAIAKFKASWPEGVAMPVIWEPDIPARGRQGRRLRR